MLPSTSSRLRQGPTHVTDTGRCPTPCLNPTEVARLGQLFLCCSRSDASPSSRVCSVLFPALRLSHAAVHAATELSVRYSQDPSDLQTASVLCPDRRGEPVVTETDEKELAARVTTMESTHLPPLHLFMAQHVSTPTQRDANSTASAQTMCCKHDLFDSHSPLLSSCLTTPGNGKTVPMQDAGDTPK